MGNIHDRMPVILPRSSLVRWLDLEQKRVDQDLARDEGVERS